MAVLFHFTSLSASRTFWRYRKRKSPRSASRTVVPTQNVMIIACCLGSWNEHPRSSAVWVLSDRSRNCNGVWHWTFDRFFVLRMLSNHKSWQSQFKGLSPSSNVRNSLKLVTDSESDFSKLSRRDKCLRFGNPTKAPSSRYFNCLLLTKLMVSRFRLSLNAPLAMCSRLFAPENNYYH